MCGVSGILHKNSSVERPAAVGAELVKMLESMTHRGRDSSGLTIAGQRTGADLIVRIWTDDQARADDVLARAEESVQRAGGVIVDRSSRGDFLRLSVNYEGDVPKLAEALLDTGHVEIHSIGRASEVIKDVGTPVEMGGRHDIGSISGTHGIGHVRMATESRVDISHAHPFWAYPFPDVTVVHNGQLTNYHGMKRAYEDRGHHFQTENDSEIIAVYLADKLADGATLGDALESSLEDLDGTFTYLVSTRDGMGYAKDRWSAKPLVTMETDDVIAVASEEVALRQVFSDEIARQEPQQNEVMTWLL